MVAPQILVVGAGPTGLVLALWLARKGVPLRIIDKAAGPGAASRAIAVHARTLEFYRQLGIADDAIDGGIRAAKLAVRVEGREVAQLCIGNLGSGLSPYPFLLSFPQDDHERMLISHLERAGVAVEWSTELNGLEQRRDSITANLTTLRGPEAADFAYVAGCDGAHSAVRETLGIGFPGGTYSQVFFVADAVARGAARDVAIHACFGERDFCLVIPVRSSGTFRLIGIVPPEREPGHGFVFDDVAALIESNSGLTVQAVNWFSTYRVHHRVAENFRNGRVFLAGDAAHVHSPAGGQGMNTGIGDAVNLAWKLAGVQASELDPAALASYEPERIAFARRLVATTDRAFQLIVSRSPLAVAMRLHVLPRILRGLVGHDAAARAFFRRISQIDVNYRGSPVSRGRAGRVHGGDRLPWLEHAGNFDPLRAMDWQVHVYGDARRALRDAAARAGVPVHAFAWCVEAHDAGLERDAFYLVRPDGHVALASHDQSDASVRALLGFFQVFGVRKADAT